MLHGFIKDVLFNPLIVCIALIVGGFVLLIVDEFPPTPRFTTPPTFPLSMYLKIGLAQCLAMIPGVSRSGATIVGAMLLGADKRAAAEFSFFLAIPTMAGAFAYDLFKNYKLLDTHHFAIIAIGFVFAFVSGLFVVKGLLTYVTPPRLQHLRMVAHPGRLRGFGGSLGVRVRGEGGGSRQWAVGCGPLKSGLVGPYRARRQSSAIAQRRLPAAYCPYPLPTTVFGSNRQRSAMMQRGQSGLRALQT